MTRSLLAVLLLSCAPPVAVERALPPAMPASTTASDPDTNTLSAGATSLRLATLPPSVQSRLSEFGLTLRLTDAFTVEDFTSPSRFDVRARPDGGLFELRYAFGAKLDDTSANEPLFARLAHIFVHNFAEEGTVCDPAPLDKAFVAAMNADDIVRLCFTPKSYLGGEFQRGVTFAVFKRNVAMLLLVVLADDVLKYGADPSVFALSF